MPVVAKLAPVLSRYFSARDKAFPSCPHAFPTRYGNAMQHREVYDLIAKLRNKLPFHFTCHMLRHTFATELARKQVNLFNISRVLGHTNVNTTKIYLNFDVDSIRETLNGVDLFA
ncbi:MAG: site-specific integrase [Patescibacteria group bacterium]